MMTRHNNSPSESQYDALALEVRKLLVEKDISQVELVHILYKCMVLPSNNRSQIVRVNNALRGKTKGKKNYNLLLDIRKTLLLL